MRYDLREDALGVRHARQRHNNILQIRRDGLSSWVHVGAGVGAQVAVAIAVNDRVDDHVHGDGVGSLRSWPASATLTM